MTTHHTDRPEPERRSGFQTTETVQRILAAIEKNRGRLSVLEYASFGLAHVAGREASCLTWIIADVSDDLRHIGDLLTGETADRSQTGEPTSGAKTTQYQLTVRV